MENVNIKNKNDNAKYEMFEIQNGPKVCSFLFLDCNFAF